MLLLRLLRNFEVWSAMRRIFARIVLERTVQFKLYTEGNAFVLLRIKTGKFIKISGVCKLRQRKHMFVKGRRRRASNCMQF
jgi:hypothetical protein